MRNVPDRTILMDSRTIKTYVFDFLLKMLNLNERCQMYLESAPLMIKVSRDELRAE